MSDVPDDLDRLNELLGAIPLECEGMTIGEVDRADGELGLVSDMGRMKG